MQILRGNFEEKRRKNIIKFKCIAKILVLQLLVSKELILMRLTRACIKLFVITVIEKNAMSRTVLSSKPIT